jgi:hypothetical protein
VCNGLTGQDSHHPWPALALVGSFELLELSVAPTLERTVRARHEAGQSQRAIARELNIDRRKIKRMIDQVA